jgi:hypothetical protein
MSNAPTPTTQIVNEANAVRETTDSKGRAIKFKRISALDRIRVLKAVGPEQSKNEPYLGYAMLAAMVVELGGVPMPFPRDDRAIEIAVDKLGDEGITAVAAALNPEVEAAE